MEIKLSSGHTVKLKPFVDRKTARGYRQTLLKNAQEKDGKYVYAPEQFDAANDVLVRGVVESILDGTGASIVPTESFFEEMNDEDFDKLLEQANKMFYKKSSEKKS